MIHLFHGFMGSPEEFNFLKSEGVIVHDLYKMTTLPEVSSEDTLIGYSMGGRVALDIASAVNYKIKKIVLISSHPGLSSPEERENRKKFENKVLSEFETLDQESFLKNWNAYPIFEFDEPIKEIPEERYKASSELFRRYLLSNQEDHLPKIIANKDKVLWIIGLLDEKYIDMAGELLISNEISVKGIEGGHRLLQKPEAVKEILLEEGIL